MRSIPHLVQHPRDHHSQEQAIQIPHPVLVPDQKKKNKQTNNQ